MAHSKKTQQFVADLFKKQPADDAWKDSKGLREQAKEAKANGQISDKDHGGAS